MPTPTTTTLVGTSAHVSTLDEHIHLAAQSGAKVLITGESGVGKEVVATLLHERSRRTGPFVSINCAGVPDSLLASELFGYLRGSFTGAYRNNRGWLDRAQDGTIFLDEVGEMSLQMQALLLRFLETGEIQRVGSHCTTTVRNVRIIAATNRNLEQRVEERAFRNDLYYRLNVIRIVIPPLRDRPEDIAPLIQHFLGVFTAAHHVPPPTVADEALATLAAYPWPGNVRELRNVVERLVLHHAGSLVSRSDLAGALPSDTREPLPMRTLEMARRSTAAALCDRMVTTGESFWTVVKGPFMSHELSRGELRALVAHGLEHAGGDYKGLLPLFNLTNRDFTRLMNFLRKHDCQLPCQAFPVMPVSSAPGLSNPGTPPSDSSA
jgi:two-component system response regulator AtoC